MHYNNKLMYDILRFVVEQKDLGKNMEKEKAVQDAIEHVRDNIIKAEEGRKCVDGRYAPGTGEIARAGGDMGYVEILLSLNRKKGLDLNPANCVDLVYDYTTKDGGMFSLHSDRHADPLEQDHSHHEERPLIGCGHCAKAAQASLAEQYNLDPRDVQESVLYVRNRHTRGDRVDIIVLEGEHEEKGAIIVDSMTHSLNERDIDGESMYFVYDRARDEDYMKRFVAWLQKEKKLDIFYDEFKAISDLQTNATLHILAQGKPIINVSVDNQGKVENLQFDAFIA